MALAVVQVNFCGQVSMGAADDLKKIIRIVYGCVSLFGIYPVSNFYHAFRFRLNRTGKIVNLDKKGLAAALANKRIEVETVISLG